MPVRWQTGKHHPAAVYAKQVVYGKLRPMCCKYEILACQRFLDDLERQGTEDFPWVFDTTRADRILEWFGRCIQIRGPYAGQPVEPQPWQVFDQSNIYGWVHKDTGVRRFTRTYNKRARGNVKSTEVSCKCNYHMCADVIYPPYQPELAQFESAPEVECAAVDRGQARRVYDDAKAIARASPGIAKPGYRTRLIVMETRVTHKTRGGFMRALSKDTANKDSGAPSYFEVDEYHAHKTSEIYNLGLNSFGKRRQSLLDVITTAGDDAEHKPCKVEEDYCKRILADPSVRKTEERYFVMIREIDDEDNPHDKSCWVKANPVIRYPGEYGQTLRDEIEAEYTTAYGSGDAEKIRKFLTRRMCRWQSGSVNRYLSEQQLAAVKDAMISREKFAALTDGLPCHCGYDLGKRIDLSGVSAVFDLPDGRIAIKMHGFMPENGAERHEHTDRVPYKAWAADGYCTLTPGDVTDNSYVYNWICDGEREHGWKTQEVDYDGHNATDLAIRICEDRNNNDFCVEIAQTCAGLNAATKGFRDMLMSGRLVLEESPLAYFCCANAIEVTNNFGDIKLSKKHKDDSERIDPLAASLNALARVLVKRTAKPDLNEKIMQDDWHIM